ncbi:hypothetical protein J2X72_001275 [Phyllobacterium sp. 1468]|uniref:hypothetical protein n=1 Tax=Phyllobacterium sp. 1468 TaxID=2817759 RepID=UPI001AE616A0|nr:hypothetical protein [Phyllobacterium sp. 1468]MDR6632491.1 hypothetical protein [Phyllobacterium sp. 1468]
MSKPSLFNIRPAVTGSFAKLREKNSCRRGFWFGWSEPSSAIRVDSIGLFLTQLRFVGSIVPHNPAQSYGRNSTLTDWSLPLLALRIKINGRAFAGNEIACHQSITTGDCRVTTKSNCANLPARGFETDGL